MSSSSIDRSSAARRATSVQFSPTTETFEQNPPLASPTPLTEEPHSHSLQSRLKRSATIHMTPLKPVGKAPGFWQGLRAVITASWLNVLLACIPVSWALHFALPKTDTNDTIIFVFSFLAIIPLAKLLAFATDELSMRVGQTLAGLLNATLGNAVELIVAIIALIKCELQVVQSSLVGSILSNLLLVLGMCFFAGGTRYAEQGFGVSSTQLQSSLLTISVIAILLPAAFHFSVSGNDSTEASDILSVSHGAAIILLFIYGSYLVFQLWSHTSLYAEGADNQDVQKSRAYTKKTKKSKTKDSASVLPNSDLQGVPLKIVNSPTPLSPQANQHLLSETVDSHEPTDVESQANGRQSDSEEEEETPSMSVPLTIALLTVVTVLVAVTAEFLVDSIDGMTDGGGISKEFVGLILLPIVGNAAEHVTAVTVSLKDKLTLSMGVAVGSSIQIALFVIPFIVTLGWIIGKPLTLLFDPFESVVLFLSVLTVNYVVQDGKSNWLEGMILMCLYVIIAVIFWFYPGEPVILQACT